MSIIGKIGSVLKASLEIAGAVAVARANEPRLDKAELLNQIESLLMTAEALKTAFGHPAVVRALAILQQPHIKGLAPDIIHMQKIYTLYFRRIPARWQQAERESTFAAARAAIEAIEFDLHKIRERFTEIFGGTDAADIRLSEMTVTMASVVGGVRNIDNYFNWMLYFICNIHATARMPPYQLVFIDKNVERFTTMTIQMVLRAPTRSILNVLEEVRRKGADVHLETDGHTLDSYADDSQYTKELLDSLNGFHFNRNPIMIVGNMVNDWRRWSYDSQKEKREWLASKVGYLTLMANKLDPQSEEAKKMERVINRYAEIVAQLDKKLGVGIDD